MSLLLSAVFFASGASALIFETLWFRQAGLAFGNSVWASSLVLSGFMAGLALGNALVARAGGRLTNPVRAYAIAEAAIALTGVALVYLLPGLGSTLAPLFRPLLDSPWALNPLRLLVAFVLLLIPSTAMGVTLPLLTKALLRDTARLSRHSPKDEGGFGRVLGALYGWNTLGAMAGVVAGEMFLVGRYGVRGTALAAGALNLLAAAAAGVLSAGSAMRWSQSHRGTRPTDGGSASPESLAPRDPPHVRRPGPATRPEPPHRGPGTWAWLVAAFGAGFSLLALEVIWFRFLLLFVKGHSNAFPVMLGVVLAGIALGGLAASLWMRLAGETHRFAAVVAFVAAVATVASYAAFPSVIAPFGLSSITLPEAILRVSLPLMLPVSLVSGIFFPLAGAALRSGLASEIETAGVLTLVNTIGAAIGSLIAGFVLLPFLGIEKSFFAVALIYAAIGAALWRPAKGLSAAPGYVGAVVCVISLALFPFGQMNTRLVSIPVERWAEGERERRLIAVREGLTETIVFFQRMLLGKPVSDVMLTNSFSMSTTGYGVRRYQKLYVYWPVAVHPALKRALLIGYGVGNTAKALTDSASVESIDVVDLSRDILAMAPVVFPEEREQPLRDPRVRVHIEDGRYFLQTSDRQFDLITGEPPPPGIAGVENLYSREYFGLMRNRLTEGGIVTYWLPLADLSDVSARAILRAFCDAFDDCSLWNGSGTNLMVAGSRNARGGASEQQFRSQWSTPQVAAEMKRLGLERPEQLGALFIGDASFIRALIDGAAPLTDDHPKLIEAPLSSQEESTRLLASITDTGAARTRFQTSPLVARLWPPGVRASSVPYFDVQHVIDAHMYGSLVTQSLALEDVHRVLTGSAVGTPVMWRLASNADIQRVVAAATPDELMNPLLQYHLAIRLLSERGYRAAAAAFERATAAPEVRDNAFVLYIYSLCMSGQRAKAQALSSEAFKASGVSSLPPLWVWMKQTFAIDPSRR
ncbi:MAG TPA: fused MFS/spermidine synthase [Vicinamibacterales bacterium]